MIIHYPLKAISPALYVKVFLLLSKELITFVFLFILDSDSTF